jgi:hypothetical protein
MVKNFEKSLSDLKHGPVRVAAPGAYPEPGCSSVQLLFANGSRLRAEYWRVTKNGRVSISSFDHEQRYGLPAPIDALKELKEHLQDKPVTDARLDGETGDLLFVFGENIKLEVFNFTGYEIWEIHFPDGTGEYSNHVK